MKILIADDEISIRQLIKKLIDPSAPLQIVGEAADGNSAYEMIQEKKPDIVITDIRMPGLNGVELMRKARENGIKVDFILVSGYRDFEYARSAVQLGALDYLLKPINREELNRVLEKAWKLRERSETMRKQLENVEEKLAKNQKILRQEFMMRYISYAEQGNVPKEIAHYRNGFLPEAGCYTVFLIKTDGNPKEMECMELQEFQRNLEMFSASYVQEMRRVCREIEVFCTGNSLYVLTNTENENVLKTLVNSLRNGLKANASAIWPFVLTIAMGTTETDLGEIGNSFTSAYYMIWERIKDRQGEVLTCDLQILKKEIRPLSEETLQEIERSIGAFQMLELKQVIENEIENGKSWENFAYGWARKLYNLMEACVRECEKYETEADSRKLFEETREKMDLYRTKEELEQFCVEFCCHLLEECIRQRKNGVGRVAKQIQDYLKEHYAEETNLEKIAEKIGLTSAYISTIFKKETGMTITNYLIQIRLEKAKEMIRDTNMTISEIAYAVGYVDTRYFSKLFIKNVGIKPVEYRRFYAK